MNREGDWYINGGFRLNLAEVTAIQPVDGLHRRVIVPRLSGSHPRSDQ